LILIEIGTFPCFIGKREVPEQKALELNGIYQGNSISEVDRQTSSGTEGTGTSEKRKI